MRIVGGEFKGRRLATPKSQDVRPTTDRTRESLFNILINGFENPVRGARVLDLYAGTGALGLEALSRGADFAVFVDNGIEARGLLRRNIETLQLEGRTKVFKRDAGHLGNAGTVAKFQLIFADPPYGKELAGNALVAAAKGGWFADQALIIVEEKAGCLPELPKGFVAVQQRSFGETEIGFYRFDESKLSR